MEIQWEQAGHGCRVGDATPIERYVWNQRLRDAYKEVMEKYGSGAGEVVSSEPGRSIWGFGWFKEWIIH